MIDLCAENSGKVQQTISEGDNLQAAVQSKVTSTSADMKSMPDPSALLQLDSPSDVEARREEMKKLAAQVKAKQNRSSHTFVARHSRSTPRKVLPVRAKAVMPAKLAS